MPVLVAALLAQATDRTPWLAAILADRMGRAGAVIAGLVAAQAILMAVSVVGALLIRDMLIPEARTLLFGATLLAAAAGAAMPPRPPADRLENWRTGALLTSVIGILVLSLGDRTQFIAFGAAAGAAHPWLVAVGATLGASIPGIVAATLGERAWRRLPLRAIGFVAAGLLGLSGLWLIGSGLRVI